jgi:hypothetical protein
MEARLLLGAVLFCAINLLVTGCAAVAPLSSALTGGASGASLEVHSETAVRLQEGNFVTIRTNVVGSSKGFNLLGFITLYPATLNIAMNRMYADAQAQHGRPQTFAHLIVEHSAIYVVLFSIPKVTARADLVEFLPADADPEDDQEIMPRNLGVQRASGISFRRRAPMPKATVRPD